jgi:hypothetical protein
MSQYAERPMQLCLVANTAEQCFSERGSLGCLLEQGDPTQRFKTLRGGFEIAGLTFSNYQSGRIQLKTLALSPPFLRDLLMSRSH